MPAKRVRVAPSLTPGTRLSFGGPLYYHSNLCARGALRQAMEPTDKKLVWSHQLNVRWSDMDANGHVNNAAFFTYFEQTRIEWLQAIAAQTTPDGHGPVVKRTSCTYLLPVTYPATLELRLYLGKPGRTSFPTYSEIWTTGADPAKVAEGEATMVWVHRESGKPQPVPDFMRQLMPIP